MGSEGLGGDIGQQVRQAVNASGMGVRGTARELGVVHETVYRWMRGEILPPLDKLERLAEITGQPITIRLGDAKDEPPPQWARALEERLVEAILALGEHDRGFEERLAGLLQESSPRQPSEQAPGQE